MDGTQKFEDPVSKRTSESCGGVPIEILPKCKIFIKLDRGSVTEFVAKRDCLLIPIFIEDFLMEYILYNGILEAT